MTALARLAAVSALALLSGGCFSEKDLTVAPPKEYSTSVEGLAFAKFPDPAEIAPGGTIVLDAAPVKKAMRGHEVRMMGYNGSIPGPLIKVKQGSEIILKLKNHTGFPTTLHAHGVRMDYLFDGASNFSQKPIADGDSFTYHLRFPDAGMYWYHAHEREDWSQEMGMYGNILVEGTDSAVWRPVDRDQMLVLDDFYLDTAKGIAPFNAKEADHIMMGRFGNLYLINGDTAFDMTVKRNEVVRFYATNAANARTFNVGFTELDGTVRKVKLVGSDNGPYEYFDHDANVLVAPGERKIFEAWFDKPGTVLLIHHILKSSFNNESIVVLGRVTVLADSVSTAFGKAFMAEDSSLATMRSIDSVRKWLDPKLAPDKELLLTGRMGGMNHNMPMKVAASQGEPISTEAKGVEWLDHMPANASSTVSNMTWAIRDVQTGKENHDISWSFKVGDKVRIRIKNDSSSTHWMPHPIHFHGQRFLVISVNGIPNLNKAWKDTYLVGMRETVDILLDASNPGGWMAHCHVAEHAEDMMMFHFRVD